MLLRLVGALVEVVLGLTFVVLAAARARGTLRGVLPHPVQAVALAAGGLALAAWGVGEALRGPTGSVVQSGALAVLVVAAVALVATTPAN